MAGWVDTVSVSSQFGKGIYFADMSSKSANYCFASQQNSTGLLLLCEVCTTDCLFTHQHTEHLPCSSRF